MVFKLFWPLTSKLDQLAAMNPRLRHFFAHSNRVILGHGRDGEPLLLNDERAAKSGLAMISKLAIFSVAGAAAIFATQGSAKFEAGTPESTARKLSVTVGALGRSKFEAGRAELPKKKLEEPHYESMEERFEAWVAKHGRTYKDEAEKEKRFKIFKETAERVDAWNKAGDKPYGCKTTVFADITDEEYIDYLRGNFNPWDESITGVPLNIDGEGGGRCSPCNENTTAAPASIDAKRSC